MTGFWAGCSKTAEIVPSSAANHTNRAQRSTNAAARRAAAFFWPNKVEIESGLLRRFLKGRFGPDFIGLYLDLEEIPIRNVTKRIRSQTSTTIVPFNGNN